MEKNKKKKKKSLNTSRIYGGRIYCQGRDFHNVNEHIPEYQYGGTNITT